MRRIVLALCVVFALLGTVAPTSAQDRDCADFATQAEAQAYFTAGGGSPSYNFNNLDANHDGVACESFPGGGAGAAAQQVPAAPVQEVPVVPAQEPAPAQAAVAEPAAAPPLAQASAGCPTFDAWEWAQSVFESDPTRYSALDPDVNGIACEELPRGGFAPAFWTDKIPADVQEAQIVRMIDGDTFEVLINGVSNRVRIYRADTPETQNEQHCGGSEATAFAEWALSFNDKPGVVYIEKDTNEKDRYGRELGYIWFQAGGQPYMLNHVLINNGYAEDVDYGDRKYDQQFKDAAAFAERHTLGVWAQCDPDGPEGEAGPWGQPPKDVLLPTQPPVLPREVPAAPLPEPTQAPLIPAPVPQPTEGASGGCDPNYTPCVPIVPGDLDCGDIGFSVTIIGSDPHGFDGNDNDGLGCESY
jgi:endonuclease YncB( thermonuclease family)